MYVGSRLIGCRLDKVMLCLARLCKIRLETDSMKYLVQKYRFWCGLCILVVIEWGCDVRTVLFVSFPRAGLGNRLRCKAWYGE